LADLGDPRLPQFKVLQSLDDHGLSFLVLPLDPASGLIAQHDLAEACAALSIAERDVAILLVVTVHRTADGVLVSANLRAPLLIDTTSRIGVQHVLPNDSYPVRLALTEEAS
jgi:flagellar assembly factor FliW